ncbi:hypothetical protein BDR07DRAFT_1494219 [Suillus spraguei]|nr:hypothetical protein BDR07DRAFT_1494219 [Suillus spraguei]
MSIVKHTSIADVTRALACSGSGMEHDIGIDCDYKTTSIKDLFSAYLILSLKQDLQDQVQREIDVDIEQLERDLFDTDPSDAPGTDGDQSSMET